MVLAVTRHQHAWFLESRSSLTNPKRSWYIWKKPRRDSTGNPLPPNNWSQILGEANSAWTYDAKTDEYFLSLFTPEQPDLNWENPAVRAAVHDVMNFWLERGVCGYRMDVINLISKDQSFPDTDPVLGPNTQYHPGGKYYVNGPRMHEYLQEIKHKVLTPHNAITVGEMPGVSDINEIIRTVGSQDGALNMIFIFDIVCVDDSPGKVRMTLHPWSVKDLRRIINKWQCAMLGHGGWNSVFVENHDNPRSVSRYTDDSDTYRTYGATLLALMQTTLSGTLFVYQGEELGMRNAPASWDPETDYKDIESLNFWRKSKTLYSHSPQRLAQERKVLEEKARDHARTPMQWTGGPNAGFCPEGVEPWMRVNDDYESVNAAAQLSSADDSGERDEQLSVWHFWQRGLECRKEHRDVFIYGGFELLGSEDSGDDILAYVRTSKTGGRWVVMLNFSGKNVDWTIPHQCGDVKWMAGNYGRGKPEKAESGRVSMRAWEGCLGRCGG